MIDLFVAAVLNILIYTLSLLVSLAGLRLKGRINQQQFFSFVALLTVASFIIAFLVQQIIRVNQGVDLVFSFLGIYFVAYIIAKETWNFSQNRAIVFGLYFSVIAFILGLAFGALASFLQVQIITHALR